MIVELNPGVSGVMLEPMVDSVAMPDGARVTVMVYVLVVVPFWAVTTTLIAVVVPSASASAPEVVPEVTLVPFTFIVALASLATGFTVMVAVTLLTLRV